MNGFRLGVLVETVASYALVLLRFLADLLPYVSVTCCCLLVWRSSHCLALIALILFFYL